MSLDRIDRALLIALQNNARLTNKELAAQVGLAPSSCLERVRKLEASGVIRGYHARVDPEALGVAIEAVVSVRLSEHQANLIDAFEDYLLSLDEMIAFYHVSGAEDYLIHVGVRDSHHLRHLAVEGLNARPEVVRAQTALVFRNRRSVELPDYLGPNT